MPMLSLGVYQTDLPNLPLLKRGKVRDVYDLNNDFLLVVATDRLSAWNMCLGTTMKGKGRILNSLSNFWFKETEEIISNHLSDKKIEDFAPLEEFAEIADRSSIVRRCRPLKIESIVRGYLAGTAWDSYRKEGSFNGIELPKELVYAQRLPQPIYTPSTKAPVNEQDKNISFEETVHLLGYPLASRIRDISLSLYKKAADHAYERGLIIADTKFEFGLDHCGELTLIDEVLTPDSSRFWLKDDYWPGTDPSSLDKEEIRDYLKAIKWDRKLPAPEIPDTLLEKTAGKYKKAFDILTAKKAIAV